MTRPRQAHDAVVSLIDWSPDEDFPVFPQGSRPKKTVIAPTVGLPDFLVPGHRYIFKYSVGRHPVQFWSEVIAYELGKLVGVVVPPAFVAIDGDGKPGALIEFFYGHPGSGTNLRYVHAKDYLTRLIPGFDEKKGREHNLMTNMRLCLFFEGKGALRGSIIFWAKTLVFDALIGNTDRHQENWGFLWPAGTSIGVGDFAPAFDNGTSLGYEQLEDRLTNFHDRSRVDAYIRRGRHHVRWSARDDHQMRHVELCARFASEWPEAQQIMYQALNINLAEVAEMLDWCTGFETPVRFSAERSAFVLTLIKARHAALTGALGNALD